jgi:hypothetical protein
LGSGVCWFKIARQVSFVHICGLTNGYWIKVDERSFKKFVVTMKNSCVETTQTLISKLQRWIS